MIQVSLVARNAAGEPLFSTWGFGRSYAAARAKAKHSMSFMLASNPKLAATVRNFEAEEM